MPPKSAPPEPPDPPDPPLAPPLDPPIAPHAEDIAIAGAVVEVPIEVRDEDGAPEVGVGDGAVEVRDHGAREVGAPVAVVVRDDDGVAAAANDVVGKVAGDPERLVGQAVETPVPSCGEVSCPGSPEVVGVELDSPSSEEVTPARNAEGPAALPAWAWPGLVVDVVREAPGCATGPATSPEGLEKLRGPKLWTLG